MPLGTRKVRDPTDAPEWRPLPTADDTSGYPKPPPTPSPQPSPPPSPPPSPSILDATPAPGLIESTSTKVDRPGGSSPTGVDDPKTVKSYCEYDIHNDESDDNVHPIDRQFPENSDDGMQPSVSSGLGVRTLASPTCTTRTQPMPRARPPTGNGPSPKGRHQPQKSKKKQRSAKSRQQKESRRRHGETLQYRQWQKSCHEQGREEQTVNPIRALPRGQWLPARHTIYTKITKKTTLVVNKSLRDSSSTDQLPSETKGLRLLQAIISYRDANGVAKTGRVKLDTCSNGCYALPELSLPRPWRPWEPRSVKGIEGNLSPLGNPTYFTLYKQGAPVTIDTNDPPPGAISDGCVALLGLDAIYDLGIDIAYAIKHNKHMPIKFIPDQENLVEDRKMDAVKQYAKMGYLKRDLIQTCNLSERVVREYLEGHPDDYISKPIDKNSVDISPGLSEDTRRLLRNLCGFYDTVFANNTNVLPPTLTGVEPHMFKLKEGAPKSVYETRPAFPPSKARAITQWLEWAKKAGLVERATNTSYASRLILAPKFKATTPKTSLPDGIRVAWAGVRVNDTIQKTVPTYPDAWEQLYKVANSKYKFSADGLKQYWSIPLCQQAREMTAFWTPDGLWQFTRLVMGTKNAATVAQNAYTHALHHMLPERSFPYIANFADDFLGGADSEEALVRGKCPDVVPQEPRTAAHPSPHVVPQEPHTIIHPFTHRDGIM